MKWDPSLEYKLKIKPHPIDYIEEQPTNYKPLGELGAMLIILFSVCYLIQMRLENENAKV